VVVLLLPACESRTFFERLASDYAPYTNVGNTWDFVVQAEDTSDLSWDTNRRTVLGGLQAVEIQQGEELLYFSRQDDGLYEWVETTRTFSDEIIVLEARWRKRLELPPATGNTWVDSYENETTFAGLPYRIESTLEGTITGIESVQTQADFFQEAIAVEIRILTTVSDPIGGETTEEILLREWYAPDVGMVRREVQNGEEWILRGFTVFP
jgi:hypothetical protein